MNAANAKCPSSASPLSCLTATGSTEPLLASQRIQQDSTLDPERMESTSSLTLQLPELGSCQPAAPPVSALPDSHAERIGQEAGTEGGAKIMRPTAETVAPAVASVPCIPFSVHQPAPEAFRPPPSSCQDPHAADTGLKDISRPSLPASLELFTGRQTETEPAGLSIAQLRSFLGSGIALSPPAKRWKAGEALEASMAVSEEACTEAVGLPEMSDGGVSAP